MSYADEKTEASLIQLEKKIHKEYSKAWKEVSNTAEEYFAKYEQRWTREHLAYLTTTKSKEEIFDLWNESNQGNLSQFEAWYRGAYQAYGKTEAEALRNFQAWEQTQLSRGQGWEKTRDAMAKKITQTNEIASAYINDNTPSIYSLNANYQAYEIGQGLQGVTFNLVDEQTIKASMQGKNFIEFKTTRTNPKRDYAWNTKQIQSALISGILQGKDIGQLSDSFLQVMGRNETSARRNARTSYTSAQNAGRVEGMRQAKNQGIDVKKKWESCGDNRVRDSHAYLDGQIRDVEKEFDNGLMFPADPDGIPAEVYNCRCTLTYIYPEFDNDKSKEIYRDEALEGETYQEFVKRMKENVEFELGYNNKRNYTINSEKLTPQMFQILMETNAERQLQLISNLCANYLNTKSQWSGVVEVTTLKGKLGSYNPITGDIKLDPNASIRTSFHEVIHSYENRDKNKSEIGILQKKNFIDAKEASVDLLAEEICKRNGVEFAKSKYKDKVSKLRTLSDKLGKDYLEFGAELVEYPASKRYNYIKKLSKGVK